MTVAVCVKDNTKEKGYYVENYLRFGHEPKDYLNGAPKHSFDESFDVCWDYNTIYAIKSKTLDFLTTDGIKNPVYGLERIGIYSDLNYLKHKISIEDLFFEDEAKEYFSKLDVADFGYSEIFKDWVREYVNGGLDLKEHFIFYVNTAGYSMAEVTDNHWLRAYNNGTIFSKKNDIDKAKLSKWMPFTQEKTIGLHLADERIMSCVYPLINLIKYHFPPLSTGNLKENKNAFFKYNQEFLDKNFEKGLSLTSINDLQYED